MNQFNNKHAPIGYKMMGKEILEQIQKPIDAFCGAVGTAGMIMGVGSVILAKWPSAQIVALEPDSCPVLSGGEPGPHSIDGTAAGFVPPLFSREVVTEVRALPEQEARTMARRLAREEGIFAGTSTGLNVVAALKLAEEVGPGHHVASADRRRRRSTHPGPGLAELHYNHQTAQRRPQVLLVEAGSGIPARRRGHRVGSHPPNEDTSTVFTFQSHRATASERSSGESSICCGEASWRRTAGSCGTAALSAILLSCPVAISQWRTFWSWEAVTSVCPS